MTCLSLQTVIYTKACLLPILVLSTKIICEKYVNHSPFFWYSYWNSLGSNPDIYTVGIINCYDPVPIFIDLTMPVLRILFIPDGSNGILSDKNNMLLKRSSNLLHSMEVLCIGMSEGHKAPTDPRHGDVNGKLSPLQHRSSKDGSRIKPAYKSADKLAINTRWKFRPWGIEGKSFLAS